MSKRPASAARAMARASGTSTSKAAVVAIDCDGTVGSTTSGPTSYPAVVACRSGRSGRSVHSAPFSAAFRDESSGDRQKQGGPGQGLNRSRLSQVVATIDFASSPGSLLTAGSQVRVLQPEPRESCEFAGLPSPALAAPPGRGPDSSRAETIPGPEGTSWAATSCPRTRSGSAFRARTGSAAAGTVRIAAVRMT